MNRTKSLGCEHRNQTASGVITNSVRAALSPFQGAGVKTLRWKTAAMVSVETLFDMKLYFHVFLDLD